MSNNPNPHRTDIACGLSELMMIFAVKFVKRFERQARHGLSPLQFHTLFILEFEGPQTMSQLCTCVSVSKQQMTPLVDKLIEQELATRSHSASDRRHVTIELSETGKAFVQKTKSEAAKLINTLLSSLPAEDLSTIERASRELSTVLKKLPDYDEQTNP